METVWSTTRRVRQLPPTYNYPLHMHERLGFWRTRATFPHLVHVHYHWLLDDDQPPDPLRARADSPLTAYQRWWLEARLRWRGSLMVAASIDGGQG